jgi:hypothetical protein
MVGSLGEPAGRSPLVLIAAIVGGVGAAVTALLPFTVSLIERVTESGTILATLLFVAWVFWGGPERAQARRIAQAQRERIQFNRDLVDRLDALVTRGARVFGEDARQGDFFGFAATRAEQAVFTQLGKKSSPTDEEVKMASLAQALRSGWSSTLASRQQAFGTCRAFLYGPARTDTSTFIEAYRLARSILESNYGAARSWLYWIRAAHPLRWGPEVEDEWAKFRDEANRLAHDWELFGVEAGTRIGVEGSYTLPLILDLRIGADPEELPKQNVINNCECIDLSRSYASPHRP